MTDKTSGNGPSLRAEAVHYPRLGGYDVIEIVEQVVRAPGPGEVRLHVRAAGVNPVDGFLRETGYAEPPLTPGMDAAGIIESVGPGVTRLGAGDAVMAIVSPFRPEGGAQASVLVVPEASVVKIPSGVSLIQAATLPMTGMTALYALELSGLRAGQTLAVIGGSGLLSQYAIAVAKRRGIRVIADARAEDADLVRSYGADVVVPRGEGVVAAVRDVAPQGVDALLDTALLHEATWPMLRDGGVYIPARLWHRTEAERGIRIVRLVVADTLMRTEWLEELCDLVASGAIKLRQTAEYPVKRVGDAQRDLAAGGLRRRPVLVF